MGVNIRIAGMQVGLVLIVLVSLWAVSYTHLTLPTICSV